MADTALLGYSTWQDVVTNYSSTDANAKFVMPKRVLDRQTPLIRMLPLKSSNNILSNVAVRTDSLPVPQVRSFNMGIKATAAHNASINDPIAMFEDYGEVDKGMWELQNDPQAWRADQDMNHIEGFFQTLESKVFYGNASDGSFNGLATRFNSLSQYPNGDQSWHYNVWSNGGSGSVTSAYIVEFGEDSVYGIYPPNTPAGLSIRDLGETTKELASGTANTGANYMYQVLRTHFRWHIGIQISDERAVQRIANINPTALSSNNFDENVFIEAINWLPRRGNAPGTVIFANRDLLTQMDIRATSQKTNAYTNFSKDQMDVFGGRVVTFQGIPCVLSEKILSTETAVS